MVRTAPNTVARNLAGWLLPAALILAWEAASRAGLISESVMAPPSAVLAAFVRLLASGELVENIGISTLRALSGFVIGGSIGFAFGLANGLSRLSRDLTDTTLQMVRNIPHLALIPLVILWFGIDEEAKLFLVALGVFFPIYVNTLLGIQESTRSSWRWAGSTACRGANSSSASSCQAPCRQSSSACAMRSASCG